MFKVPSSCHLVSAGRLSPRLGKGEHLSWAGTMLSTFIITEREC